MTAFQTLYLTGDQGRALARIINGENVAGTFTVHQAELLDDGPHAGHVIVECDQRVIARIDRTGQEIA